MWVRGREDKLLLSDGDGDFHAFLSISHLSMTTECKEKCEKQHFLHFTVLNLPDFCICKIFLSLSFSFAWLSTLISCHLDNDLSHISHEEIDNWHEACRETHFNWPLGYIVVWRLLETFPSITQLIIQKEDFIDPTRSVKMSTLCFLTPAFPAYYLRLHS